MLAGHSRGLEGMNMRDAFALVVALVAEDGSQTGWSTDPSKRQDVYKTLGITVAPLGVGDETDPMLTPPPAASAQEQLEELRAAMKGQKPETPADD